MLLTADPSQEGPGKQMALNLAMKARGCRFQKLNTDSTQWREESKRITSHFLPPFFFFANVNIFAVTDCNSTFLLITEI